MPYDDKYDQFPSPRPAGCAQAQSEAAIEMPLVGSLAAGAPADTAVSSPAAVSAPFAPVASGRLAEGVSDATAKDYPPQPDLIQRPSHYVGKGGLECITIIHSWGLGYDLGTALAYILRHQRKGEPLRDLKKALRHLEMADIEAALSHRVHNDDLPVSLDAVVAAFALDAHAATVVTCIYYVPCLTLENQSDLVRGNQRRMLAGAIDVLGNLIALLDRGDQPPATECRS